MLRTLDEIESHAYNATRGAGLPHEIAREASQATRWMSARGYDGARLLANCLVRALSQPDEEMDPILDDGPWHRLNGDLCPVQVGIALNQHAGALASGQVITMTDVSEPSMLIPFAAHASLACGRAIKLESPACHVVLHQGELLVPPGGFKPAAGFAESVIVVALETAPMRPMLEASEDDIQIRDDLWKELDLLARRNAANRLERAANDAGHARQSA